jgi:hypothetical protein
MQFSISLNKNNGVVKFIECNFINISFGSEERNAIIYYSSNDNIETSFHKCEFKNISSLSPTAFGFR